MISLSLVINAEITAPNIVNRPVIVAAAMTEGFMCCGCLRDPHCIEPVPILVHRVAISLGLANARHHLAAEREWDDQNSCGGGSGEW
jgi:hypothetical protein